MARSMMAEPSDSDDQFEGDDLYATLSSDQYNDTDLGSSPVKARPSSSFDSGVDDFVFATQASIEEDMERPVSPSIRLASRRSKAKFNSPMMFDAGKPESSRHKKSSPKAIASAAPTNVRRVSPPSPSRHPYKQLESQSSPTRKRAPAQRLDMPIRKPVTTENIAKPIGSSRTTKWSAQLPHDVKVIDLTLEEILGPPPEAGPSRPVTSKAHDQGFKSKPIVIEDAPPIELSAEQRAVLDLVVAGQSLFFTGSAGTGKSVLLREIIKRLATIDVEDADGKIAKKRVAITASTGIAGLNIGGQTIHSWAGVNLGNEPVEVYAERAVRQDKEKRIGRADANIDTALERWTKTDVLIVDEMSMIDGRFLDKLEAIGRKLRKNDLPFGGIQLVLCGDFFQLPPVPDQNKSVFAFEAESWPRCVPRIIKLTQVFRQANQMFVDMLTEARIGQLSGKTIRGFSLLQRPVYYEDGIDATELFPTKWQSDRANQTKLKRLVGETRMFVAIDKEGIQPNGDSFSHKEAVTLLDKSARAPAVLELRIGAQVMLVMNMPSAGLCNGSTGRVVAFETVQEERQRITEEIAKQEKKDKADRPVDETADSQKKGFPRVASEALLKLLAGLGDLGPAPPPPGAIPIGNTYRHDADVANSKWPVIEFSTGQRKLMVPQDFDVNSQKGVLEAKRIQVPLILAWALSIHKAQGITMPRLKVDLARTFEKGQAYVALSRATSLETLEVTNFRAASVLAHPKVIEWSKSLEQVQV